MNGFQKNELKGRAMLKAILKQYGLNEYSFTEDEYNPVDCYFNYNHQCYIAEIKVRKNAYSTLFMEKNKLCNMVQLIKDGKAVNGYYVNFIGNKAYLFAIKDICRYLKQQKAQGKRVFYSRLLPKTTSGNTEKMWKEITELPLSIATCLTLNNYNYEKTRV